MLNAELQADDQQELAGGGRIPRAIYQTFSTHQLPPEIEKNIEKISTLNPGWSHHVFSDEEKISFVEENYDTPTFRAYLSIKPEFGAARADLFRYLLIYKLGGVYLDIKSTIKKPLCEVILPTDQFLLSQWKNKKRESFENWGLHRELEHIPGGEFQQWFIVSAPGHPFLKAVIEKVLRNIRTYNPILHGVGRMGVLRLTGPIAYTLSIFPLLEPDNHRLVDSMDELGFEYSIYQNLGNDAHQKIFNKHYSKILEPVVTVSGLKESAWQIYKNLHLEKHDMTIIAQKIRKKLFSTRR